MPRRWRAFHTDLPRASGASVQLSPLESHHVRRVLRLSPGDPLALFDGCGNEWSGTIVGLDSDGVTVEMKQRLEDAVESALDVRVYQGLCRQEKMDQVVQKLTEIGVAAIHPLGCRNAERFPPDDKRFGTLEADCPRGLQTKRPSAPARNRGRGTLAAGRRGRMLVTRSRRFGATAGGRPGSIRNAAMPYRGRSGKRVRHR